jgi:hypothetical protein
MPMHWRRMAWFVSFALAILLIYWLRGLGYGWISSLGLGLMVWVVGSFVISQLCAALILLRYWLWRHVE